MKKAIGLTADVSTFNTTLPQTRHLNYFMNTNPQRFAEGGDVKAGIPNYPNPNVTSGFLPMALGFAPGGEADGYFSKLYRAAIKVVAGYLGKSEDDEQVKEIAKKFIETDDGKAIANKLLTQDEAYKVDVPSDRQPGIDTVKLGTPSDRQPQFNLPQPVTPTDTVTTTPEPITTRSDRQGAFDNVPMQPLPKISTEQQQREYEDSQKSIEPKPQMTPPEITPSNRQPGIGIANEMQPKGGITEIEPEKANMLDLNGDGEVNIKDLEFAYQNGLEWAIPLLKKALDIVEEWNPDKPEKIKPDEGEKIVPETPEKIVPETPEKIVPETPEKIKPKKPEKIKPQPDGGGIRGSGRGTDLGGMLETQRRKADTLTKEDQKTLKIASDIEAGGDGGIETLKNKKDVPAWALPMMSAGFAMMASKNPNFLGALGEAGQAGVESYSAQKQAEEDKLDKEAERAYKKSMATYYEGREQKPDIKILTVDGRGVYHKWDSKKQNYISLDKIAVPSDAEIATELETLYGADLWSIKTFDEKQKLITEKRNQYLGIASDNVTSGNKAAEGGGNWLEDWKETIESWNPDRDD